NGRRAMRQAIIRAGAAALLFAPAAIAQDTYRFTINQPLSAIQADFTADAPFAGTFIGNYHPQNNPNGTRTLNGVLGLCTPGNEPIAYSGGGNASGSPSTNPTGSFTLRVDTASNRAV